MIPVFMSLIFTNIYSADNLRYQSLKSQIYTFKNNIQHWKYMAEGHIQKIKARRNAEIVEQSRRNLERYQYWISGEQPKLDRCEAELRILLEKAKLQKTIQESKLLTTLQENFKIDI